MNRQYLSALVLTLVLCLVAIQAEKQTPQKRDTVSPRYIETGPANEAVVLGETPNGVTLRCRVPPEIDALTRPQWFEFGTVNTGNQISDTSVVLPAHPNSHRYRINATETGQYDLIIDPVELSDGTYYLCRDFNGSPADQSKLGAQLVVIEAAPNCTTTTTTSTVMEGDYHTMECIIYFRAYQGVAPVMTWTGPDPFLTTQSVTNNSVWSGISFIVSRSMDSESFQCLTNFTSNGFNGSNSAENIPTYSSLYRSLQILVQWAPKNMYYSPDQTNYDVGVVITCYADAFPQATIFWQNLDTNQVYNNPSFVITADMVGDNRMRCHAENFINGEQYFNDLITVITVNPVPTTQTPGPSTTTTSPPPEAYCSDLTGQWQSDNPKATMCVWIDHATNGVVSGLLRNDTDSYWLDIFGLVQLNTFDQGGFSTISPGSIGVTAYVLECKACNGVETMAVSQAQRSQFSVTECDEYGATHRLPEFTFHRVPSASPCNSLPPSL